jgi:hypothetical protein
MSKDPAFLFYSSDFLTGTMFMDNEQVGKFIRLMCAQHQKGRLSEKDMLKICGTHDADIHRKAEKMEYTSPHFSTYINQKRWNDELPYQQSVENKGSWLDQFR